MDTEVKRHKKNDTINGLGERLKKFRISKGLTQVEMAEILKSSQGNVTAIENGKRGITDVMLLQLYQRFPDFDAKEILIGE